MADKSKVTATLEARTALELASRNTDRMEANRARSIMLTLKARRRFYGLNALVAGALTMVLSGCGGQRPEESHELRAVTPIHAVPLFDEDGGRISHGGVLRVGDEIGEGPTAGADGRLDILMLSAGGSSGAYGAGVLYGWTESGQRPEFDIVTGVSTGAVIATLAFLGPEYDHRLQEFYTGLENDDIFRERSLLGALTSESLYDYEPFKDLIAEVMDEPLLDRIAEEHRKGRRLYIASTNLDGGRLVVWDLGALADSDRHNRLLRSQKILRASAAVPGFFTPVYMKPRNGVELRQAHVDGGIKAPLLLESFMLDVPAEERHLYAIVNTGLKLNNDTAPVQASIADVARKALAELLREGLKSALFRAYILSRHADAEFRATYIPDDVEDIAFGLDFDPERMAALFEAGRAVGRQPAEWRDAPPLLTPLERGRP